MHYSCQAVHLIIAVFIPAAVCLYSGSFLCCTGFITQYVIAVYIVLAEISSCMQDF